MPPRNEAELLDQTVELAMHCKWAVCHFRPARTRSGWRTAIQGHIGFPDLVLARAGVVLFRELKGARGRPSSEQRDWGRQIDPTWDTDAAVRLIEPLYVPFDVWRPADWVPVVIPTLTAARLP
jgi:hypothetical protein